MNYKINKQKEIQIISNYFKTYTFIYDHATVQLLTIG